MPHSLPGIKTPHSASTSPVLLAAAVWKMTFEVLLVVSLAVASVQGQYPTGGGGGDGQQQQQAPPFVDPSVPLQSSFCEEQHACVDWDLCLDGEINTSGSGQLDVRIPNVPIPPELLPQACPQEGAFKICCRIPYDLWVQQVWLGECAVHQTCVPTVHCGRDGVIDTSGAGLLDPRITPQKCTLGAHQDQYQGQQGVCCRLPDPLPQLTCPIGSQCVDAGVCASTNIFKNAQGYDAECYTNTVTADVGVCCAAPPAPVLACPGVLGCQNKGACRGGILSDDYGFEQSCYIGTDGIGVCCDGPVASCSSDDSFFCSPRGSCLGQTSPDPYNAATSLSCYLAGTNAVGECCQTPVPLDTCGANQVCLPGNRLCAGGAILNSYNDEQTCYTGDGNVGTCCGVPEPLLTCDAGYSCHDSSLCEGHADTIATFPDCYVNDITIGKCCNPKFEVPTIDTCPGESVCLPELLCLGEILDSNNVYHPFANQGTWARCLMSGTGLVSPGVCCRNPTTPTPDLPPPADQCGVRNYGLDTRIQNQGDSNNHEAQFGEFSWQAIIFFTNFTFKCGASLIADEWLLTAAHCVDGYAPEDLRVRLGEWKVDSYDEPGQYEDVYIHSIIVHELYNHAAKNLFNDIALLKLTAPVNFQYHINTVCVPNQGQVFYGATRCYATGWGKDAFDGGRYQVTMKKVDLPLVPRDQCQYDLRKTRLGRFFKLHESFLCAGGEAGKDACEGDGGGPLVCQDPATGNYVVTGITAWGIGCAEQNIPGVYVDVQYFREWMDGKIFGTGDQQQQQQGGGNYGRK
ncbi:hypothetical protein Pmani_029523 [Petrolisthes manimaculis]|uniref:Peptidase S1 domain-containing protein n=1 Tax=Petrolisthes manimaculis TaxID=1843537 RepID=A0AAE1NXE5_9EUCA|nr:hypothetical protein Pmani_029523 [Petrolisthes manimaculis]